MLKASEGLKMLKIPKNNPLNMSCTEWQKKFEETILKLTLISNVKKIFLKASLRV
jgi:hypothetical protein